MSFDDTSTWTADFRDAVGEMEARDPRGKQEFMDMSKITVIAYQLSGARPLPPGMDHAAAIAQLERLLCDRDYSIAFTSLKSEPPSLSALESNGDLTVLMQLSFKIFGVISSSLPADCPSWSHIWSLWPHIVKWGAVLHPARRLLVCAHRERNRMVHAATDVLLSAYIPIILSSPERVKPFIHSSPAIVLHVLKLWIDFPHYTIPALTPYMAFSAPPTIKMILDATFRLATLLVLESNHPTSEDRVLFVELCRRVVHRKRHLLRAAEWHTDHLRMLAIPPAIFSKVWSLHADLFHILLDLPEFEPTMVPRNLMRSLVAGTYHVAAQSWPTENSAASLVHLICYLISIPGKGAKTLAHAINAGFTELAKRFGREGYNDFAGQATVGLVHVSVLQAIRRHYDQLPKDHAHLDPPSIPFWHNLLATYEARLRTYNRIIVRKEWKNTMLCHNAHGPHNYAVRICPCAGAFYCSGSCQRMHWKAGHAQYCFPIGGPLALRSVFSTADILFICGIAQDCIGSVRADVATGLARIQSQPIGSSARQLAILVDLSDVTTKYEVSARSIIRLGTMGRLDIVLVEVLLRLGLATEKCLLPVRIPLGYFGLGIST